MIDLGFLPSETYIFEDSPTGILAAKTSGANLIFISSPNEIIYDNILNKMNSSKENTPFIDINILIPMAGNGSRFQKAGYTFPKPLIDVNGIPMIQNVVNNFGFKANFIFVVRKEHREKYALDLLLNNISPNCKIVEVENLTEGAACTTLLAKEFINNDKELILANSDQYIDTDLIQFLYNARNKNVDISYLCFDGCHPKFSFVKTDDNGFITEAAEKKPISNIANVGVYYWKRGKDFVKYTEEMISKNIRTNGEFFNSPAVNEAIKDNKRANVQMVAHDKFWCTGDPESLQYYLNNFKK
jgi:dTDP-glucose pyrophosphorylase